MNYRKYGDDVDFELYNLKANENLCYEHLNADFINREIEHNGEIRKCTYCHKSRKTYKLSQVLELLIVGIEYLFEDPANSRYLNKESLHGFDGNTFNFYEIWYDDYLELKIDDSQLFDDIYNYLNNDSIYCYKDEFTSEAEFLDDLWSLFKKTVKHNARYVFHFEDVFKAHGYTDPVDILSMVQNLIHNLDIFTYLKKGTNLYRCRQHENLDDIKEDYQLASVPDVYNKKNGRMNPAGISMFYCSKNKSLSIKEVVDQTNTSKPYYTTGIFSTNSEIKLVNLSNLPKRPSIFDKKNNDFIDAIDFLYEFVKNITQPIHSKDSIIEYVPTQIVTEYIRFNPKLAVDGIIYPSAKDNSFNNIVLFFNNQESLEKLTFDKSSLETVQFKNTLQSV